MSLARPGKTWLSQVFRAVAELAMSERKSAVRHGIQPGETMMAMTASCWRAMNAPLSSAHLVREPSGGSSIWHSLSC